MIKYHNKPNQVGSEKYRSHREAKRHAELQLMESAGMIAGLLREVPFILAHGVKIDGEKHRSPAMAGVD